MKTIKHIISIGLVICGVMMSLLPACAETSHVELALGGVIDTMEPILDSGNEDFPCSTVGTLPSSVDLSASNSFPQVRSQGEINSCASWAATYYQFGYQVATLNGWDAKFDSTMQFSPKWAYNLVNQGENVGVSFTSIYDVLKRHGAVRYSEFTPSVYATVPEYREWYTDANGMRTALEYRISDYNKYLFSEPSVNTPINSYNSSKLVPMKSLLNSGFVLTFITDFDTWDYQILTTADGSSHVGEQVCIKQYDDNDDGDYHALAIVGYDDSIQYDLNKDGVIQDFEKGAFKIVNSHGVDYGNQGFMWVMYDALNLVSNASIQNVDGRQAILYSYLYYVAVVEEYNLDLVSEVTITIPKRNQVLVELGLSSLNSLAPQQKVATFLTYSGSNYNYSGIADTVQSATFLFDFGTLISHPAPWKKYYIKIADTSSSSDPVVIDKICIVDSSNKYVIDDTEEKTINAYTRYFGYKIGMVGDVDNSGSVTSVDVTTIQSHLAQISTLSNEALVLADVDGDGSVSTTDCVYIQRVLAKVDDRFANGVYACID
ncbi:MAG: hypothetical protein IJ275_03555 [Ruminococcus sp.]|nr:hypothetical protein [Ruminococcus sp.]